MHYTSLNISMQQPYQHETMIQSVISFSHHCMVVLMTDADISSDYDDVGDFGEVTKRAPLVWGARFLGGRLLPAFLFIVHIVIVWSLRSNKTELKSHQSCLRQDTSTIFPRERTSAKES